MNLPLTLLAEDGVIFRARVGQFANVQVHTLVREMYEYAKIPNHMMYLRDEDRAALRENLVAFIERGKQRSAAVQSDR
jgi:hypothetical protein